MCSGIHRHVFFSVSLYRKSIRKSVSNAIGFKDFREPAVMTGYTQTACYNTVNTKNDLPEKI